MPVQEALGKRACFNVQVLCFNVQVQGGWGRHGMYESEREKEGMVQANDERQRPM